MSDRDPPRYALLTKVLDARHTIVLEDWLEFLGRPPDELVVYVAGAAAIRRSLDRVTERSKIPWRAIPVAAGDDLARHETAILSRMVATTACEYLLFVTLDALPFRRPSYDEDWLDEVFHRLRAEGLVFFSACGLLFRGDRPEAGGRYLVTQRFSNNCGLVSRRAWLDAIEKYPEHLLRPQQTRFHSEWALEHALRIEKRFGLRRRESAEWRVFHVQQWDARLLATRDRFRRGVGIAPYLNRVWEELPYPEAEFYNYPVRKKLEGRLRVTLSSLRRWIGKLRRSVAAGGGS